MRSHIRLISLLALFFMLTKGVNICEAQPEISVKGKLFTNLEAALLQPDSVTRLRLRHRRYREIPPEIYRLSRLKELDLSANRLQHIPAEIYQLEELEIIRLSRNKIVTIAPGISRLQKLRYLDLGMNPIQQLPEEMGNLTQLEFLQIWGTEITVLPQMLEKLEQLRWLDMRNIILTDGEREDVYNLLPKATIYLSEGCNCGK